MQKGSLFSFPSCPRSDPPSQGPPSEPNPACHLDEVLRLLPVCRDLTLWRLRRNSSIDVSVEAKLRTPVKVREVAHIITIAFPACYQNIQ